MMNTGFLSAGRRYGFRAFLVLITHGINLAAWAFLMHQGVLEDTWILWRVYALAALVWSIFPILSRNNVFWQGIGLVCPVVWMAMLVFWLLWATITWQISVPDWYAMFYFALVCSQWGPLILAIIGRLTEGP